MATSFLLRSHGPGFSRWSRYDVVSMPHGPTDHWAKMKLHAEGNPGSANTKENGTSLAKLGQAVNGTDINQPQKHWGADGPDASKYVSRDPVFHKVSASAGRQDGCLLSSSSWNSSSTSRRSRVPRSSYYERAKSGFQYWPRDRPNPTRYRGYDMGSKGTTLGIAFV